VRRRQRKGRRGAGVVVDKLFDNAGKLVVRITSARGVACQRERSKQAERRRKSNVRET
jgi:hypothetical protein